MRGYNQFFVRNLIIKLLLAAMIVAFVWSRGYELFVTWGPSMEPTLESGDIIVVNKISYDYTSIDRFDVVVLRDVEDGGYMVKRIVGLPMEVIEIKDGTIYIDGRQAKFNYRIKPDRLDVQPVKVPAGHYFYIGDNMEWTTWGLVTGDNVVGKAKIKNEKNRMVL